MGWEIDSTFRITGKAIEYIEQFIEKGEDVYEKGNTFFNFKKFFDDYKDLEHSEEFEDWSWCTRKKCMYSKSNVASYLDFTYNSSFPSGIARKLSRLFPEEVFRVSCYSESGSVEFFVYKNGCVIHKDYYDDDSPSEEIDEVYRTLDQLDGHSKNEEFIEDPEEAKEYRIKNEVSDFLKEKDNYPKNDDGTFIISDDMTEGAKIEAAKQNEMILENYKEPTYDEIVNELDRTSLTREELDKVFLWLNYHTEFFCFNTADMFIRKDMPFLVKAHIVFKRKEIKDHEEDYEDFMKWCREHSDSEEVELVDFDEHDKESNEK